MDLITGTGDGCASTTPGVFPKGGEDGRNVLGPEFDVERKGRLPVVLDDGRQPFHDSFCFAFPVGDRLLRLGRGKELLVHLDEGADGLWSFVSVHGISGN